ncbi:MAG TPA: transposase zinc-binding domain-containing protein [Kofleriaceae bacterium]|nr:transposase zinc-binding domain-containing protein [Kofleriaceae bacterium]
MLAEVRAADPEGGGLPRHVERELAEYLRCGVLAHGFARVRCTTCHEEIVVAFSCKRRGLCPSCGFHERESAADRAARRGTRRGARR